MIDSPWLNPAWRPPASITSTIVFVHGAVVNGEEMFPLRHRLRRLGYRTRQFHYQSMLKSLDHNVLRLADFIRHTEGDVIHVIGHSMGGVLTRQVFERMPDPRPGRLIAVGSPFLDCWVGRRFNQMHLGRYLIGKTVHDHISGPRDPVWRGTRDFGILAGIYPVGIAAIFKSHPHPSDGVVLLEETQLEGVRDRVVFKLNHFGMLLSTRCCAQIACFLATGAFEHPAAEPAVPKTPGLATV
jgi:pimeloyl-ACP methyl ester carboxylesterase